MKTILRATAVCLVFGGSALALTGERFPEIPLDKMTPQQRTVADAIMSGPRQRMSGPFNAWLRSPELADRLQKVGEYVRYKTSLPLKLNEFAILITAREWTSQYEWYAHYPLALKAGLDAKLADELALGQRPSAMTDDEAAVYDFCVQLHRTRNVDDAAFNHALALFGEQGVVDLIGVSGYYTAVSMTLNVARVVPPDGVPLPLKPLSGARSE